MAAMKTTRRRVKVTSSVTVSRSGERDIRLEGKSLRGRTVYSVEATLDLWSAAQLVREVRGLLHKIQAQQVADLKLIMNQAEGEL